MAAPTIKLNNGKEMPSVGLGLWKLDNDIAADTIYEAIKQGYRLFDGACDYGNEVECGQGVARAIKDGLVTREELFITSKLWNSFHDPERVVPICKKQLQDWGLDYFDLYLIHFPISLVYVDPSVRYPPGWEDADGNHTLGKASVESTYHAMEQVYEQGLAKSIGISNYNAALIIDLLAYAKIKPQVLQIEHHPYLVQQPLVDLCQKNGIAITAYSSFGPQSFLELMDKAGKVPLLFEHPLIKGLAAKYGKNEGQVLLRWATQRGLAVIPKSKNAGRLRSNIDLNFDMTPEELAQVSSLDQGLRFNAPPNYGIDIPIFA
ncbi:putative NAD(P)H-dependent D-xylose reductase xyl1 [Lineolata rhizophorae]|uniref:Putative NAD(P)H-dependent D-xylose reductase xyl1 n=1 Tax=Lineolata rhizophorae TaxID=578093 RepID=A0A6A6NXX3_9PEZI|nr:putative NAD(P)H-dependent D-xylose reductase xyl1 [Lineolata rhizophorae]